MSLFTSNTMAETPRSAHSSTTRLMSTVLPDPEPAKIAVCRDGDVVDMTALDIGARLIVRDAQGRVTRLEEAGKRFAAEAGLALAEGSLLDAEPCGALAARMADRLFEAIDGGRPRVDGVDLLRLDPLTRRGPVAQVSFSGGVAEYIYGGDTKSFGDLGLLLAQPVAGQDLKAKGEKVYADQKCSVCHSIAGKGNTKGALDEVGSRLSEADIRAWITDAKGMTAKTGAPRKPVMKQYSLPKDDVDALVRHADNVNIARQLRDRFPHPYTRANAIAFLKHATSAEPPTSLAIEVDDQAVGGIGYVAGTDVERYTAEIGYWLSEQYWGRGIVTEALMMVTTFAFTERNVLRLYAVPFADNLASMRVL